MGLVDNSRHMLFKHNSMDGVLPMGKSPTSAINPDYFCQVCRRAVFMRYRLGSLAILFVSGFMVSSLACSDFGPLY
jgi:hypothetical protein